MRVFILIAIAALAAWGLLRVGIRIGGSRAAGHIVDGFVRSLDVKTNSEAINKINQRVRNFRHWYSISGSGDADNIVENSEAIGESLAQAGLTKGMETQQALDAPRQHETRMTMDSDELRE